MKSILYYSSGGEIGAGNYSYYYLEDTGNYKIQLISSEGDADLYVSDTNLKVTFYDYKWQSITYGDDEIIIGNTVERPISISVYGHPYYPSSKYKINVYMIEHELNNFEEYTYNDFVKQYSNYNDFIENDRYSDQQTKSNERETTSNNEYAKRKAKSNKNEKKVKNNEEEESLLQKIVVGILKILAEIILN